MHRLLPALLLLTAHVAFAQGDKPIPPKIQSLKANYEAAILRATAPLTKTYVQELQRVKLEYTRAVMGAVTGVMLASRRTTPSSATRGAVRCSAWLAPEQAMPLTAGE
jgi:hypothetical protein